MRREGFGDESALRRRMAHHREVERWAVEALQEIVAVAHGKARADARVPLAETPPRATGRNGRRR
jgi:hypothetical protein